MPGPEDAVAGHWEHFSHEADIGVRGFGKTKEEAFIQAGLALTGVLCDPRTVLLSQTVEVACRNGDDEMLLYDWLNAIIFEMATRRMLFGAFEVEIDGSLLRGRLKGESIDIARHEPAVEIKGATFTELRVSHTPQTGWLAQCVVDV